MISFAGYYSSVQRPHRISNGFSLTASAQLLSRQPAELAAVVLHIAALLRSYGSHAADVCLVGLRPYIARVVAVRPRAIVRRAVACTSQIA